MKRLIKLLIIVNLLCCSFSFAQGLPETASDKITVIYKTQPGIEYDQIIKDNLNVYFDFLSKVVKKEYKDYSFAVSIDKKQRGAGKNVAVAGDKSNKIINLKFDIDAFDLLIREVVYTKNQQSADGFNIDATSYAMQEFSFSLFEELNLDFAFLLDSERLRTYLEDNLLGKKISIDPKLSINELLYIYKHINYLPYFLKTQMALKGIKRSYDQNYPYAYYVKEQVIALKEDALTDNCPSHYNGKTLLHEIGHAVYYGLTEDIQNKFSKQAEETREYISDYSRTDIFEDFAEHFAAYIVDNEKIQYSCPNKFWFLNENVFSYLNTSPDGSIRKTDIQYHITVPENCKIYITDGYDNIYAPSFMGDAKDNIELLETHRNAYIKLKIKEITDVETPDDIEIVMTWRSPSEDRGNDIKKTLRYKKGDDIYTLSVMEDSFYRAMCESTDAKLVYKLEHFIVQDGAKKGVDYAEDLQGKLDFTWFCSRSLSNPDYFMSSEHMNISVLPYNKTKTYKNDVENKETLEKEKRQLITFIKERLKKVNSTNNNAFKFIDGPVYRGYYDDNKDSLYIEWLDKDGHSYFINSPLTGTFCCTGINMKLKVGHLKISQLYWMDFYGNKHDLLGELTDQEKEVLTLVYPEPEDNSEATPIKQEEKKTNLLKTEKLDESLSVNISLDTLVVSKLDTINGSLLTITGSINKEPSRLVLNIYKGTNKEEFYKEVDVDKSKITYDPIRKIFQTVVFIPAGTMPAGFYSIYPQTNSISDQYKNKNLTFELMFNEEMRQNCIKLNDAAICGSSYFADTKNKIVRFELPVKERKQSSADAIKVSGTIKYKNKDEIIIKEYNNQVAKFDATTGKYYLDLDLGEKYENGSINLTSVKTVVNNASGAPTNATVVNAIEENTVVFEIRVITQTTIKTTAKQINVPLPLRQ